MNYVVIGLGNPGEEYVGTRHNAGRTALTAIAKSNSAHEWREDGKLNSLVSEGKIGKHSVTYLLPNTFMNNSGKAVSKLITSAKKAENLIVLYDDLDLPLGNIKLSYGRSSGGHNGLESIIKAVKTKNFLRIRIGVSPATPSGKIKKPSGEKAVIDFLMKPFKPSEETAFKKVAKKIGEALEVAVSDGREKAMSQFN